MSRRILAAAFSCLLSRAALPAQTAPAGVVLQSANARLNTVDAAIGTTVYDGDRMETQEKGALSLRSGQIQLTLRKTAAVDEPREFDPHSHASARHRNVSRGRREGVEIRADDVRVRPHSPVLTVGQVTLEKCDMLVTARTQSLEVTAGKETKILEEGKTYRVVRKGACGAARYHAPLAGGQSRFLSGRSRGRDRNRVFGHPQRPREP